MAAKTLAGKSALITGDCQEQQTPSKRDLPKTETVHPLTPAPPVCPIRAAVQLLARRGRLAFENSCMAAQARCRPRAWATASSKRWRRPAPTSACTALRPLASWRSMRGPSRTSLASRFADLQLHMTCLVLAGRPAYPCACSQSNCPHSDFSAASRTPLISSVSVPAQVAVSDADLRKPAAIRCVPYQYVLSIRRHCGSSTASLHSLALPSGRPPSRVHMQICICRPGHADMHLCVWSLSFTARSASKLR